MFLNCVFIFYRISKTHAYDDFFQNRQFHDILLWMKLFELRNHFFFILFLQSRHLALELCGFFYGTVQSFLAISTKNEFSQTLFRFLSSESYFLPFFRAKSDIRNMNWHFHLNDSSALHLLRSGQMFFSHVNALNDHTIFISRQDFPCLTLVVASNDQHTIAFANFIT